MGMLIDGVWTDEDLRNTDKGGAFQRVESSFRDFATQNRHWSTMPRIHVN